LYNLIRQHIETSYLHAAINDLLISLIRIFQVHLPWDDHLLLEFSSVHLQLGKLFALHAQRFKLLLSLSQLPNHAKVLKDLVGSDQVAFSLLSVSWNSQQGADNLQRFANIARIFAK